MSFSIIHLSDLHVSGSSQDTMLQELSRDIKRQCEYLDNIVIVVTGDLVNCGIYSNETQEAILNFFNSLKSDPHLSDSIKSIQFVPGNHDRHHINTVDDILIEQIFEKSQEMMGKKKKDIEKKQSVSDDAWDYHKVSYTEYINLINSIRKIFMKTPKIITDTTYWENVCIDLMNIAFLNLDTSWSSKGGLNDYTSLHIDFNKLAKIRQEYQKARQSGIVNFTVTSAHHPLNWITYEEANSLQEWLMDKEYFETNLYLCGHTHDRKITSIQDNRQGFLTLVTGFGWPTGHATESKDHRRYSIYTIDIKNSSCIVNIRKTNQRLQFACDHDMLLSTREKRLGKILLPLKQKSIGSFIEAHSFKDSAPSFLLVDNKISVLCEICTDFRAHMKQFQEIHIRKTFQECTCSEQEQSQIVENAYKKYFYGSCEATRDIIKPILSQTEKKPKYEKLSSYLQEMCQYFITDILNHRDSLQFKSEIRILFRRYNPSPTKEPVYTTVTCKSSATVEDSIVRPREIFYNNSLIEYSFIENKGLVYNHNKMCNEIDTQIWKDCLTISPKVMRNINSVSEKGGHIEYPYLSCSILVQSLADSQFLDLLSFIKIDELFKTIILEYLELFDLNFSDFFDFLDYYPLSNEEENIL